MLPVVVPNDYIDNNSYLKDSVAATNPESLIELKAAFMELQEKRKADNAATEAVLLEITADREKFETDLMKLKAAMGPLKELTDAVIQLNEAQKVNEAAVAQMRETIRERDSVLFDLGYPQPPTTLINELLQSSQIAVDKFRGLVLLYGNQLLLDK